MSSDESKKMFKFYVNQYKNYSMGCKFHSYFSVCKYSSTRVKQVATLSSCQQVSSICGCRKMVLITNKTMLEGYIRPTAYNKFVSIWLG